MADVFLSYSHLDLEHVRPLQSFLEAHGLTVWWDTRLRTGDHWDASIEKEISEALCVIVVWSRNSVTSHWVKSEADLALQRKKLFPIRLDGCELPLAFRLIQANDFSQWLGDPNSPECIKLIDALKARLPIGRQQPTRADLLDRTFSPKLEWNVDQALKVNVGPAISRSERWLLPGSGNTDWFCDIDGGPEMVVVPAGTFQMGAPPQEQQSAEYERPQRVVVITRPFAISRHCTSYANWDQAVHEGGVAHNPDDRGWGRGPLPVINVSWDDARAYIAWLSRISDHNYFLPSEAQWEYCCRAGSSSPFSFGEQIRPADANYDYNYSYKGSPKTIPPFRTVDVGSYASNAWGLHQMHGNVREWCEDYWNANYKGAPTNETAWRSGDPSLRVVRGGAWRDRPENLRSADRDGRKRSTRAFDVGFRVVRQL